MRVTWLPEVLEAAGLDVATYPGWRDRGSAAWGMDNPNPAYRWPLQGVVAHATAGSRQSTDAGEMAVLWRHGSTSAPAPISQLYLSRSGTWWVGASGRCNHVLVGDRGPLRGYGNYQLLGVEAANDNRGEPWGADMLACYQLGIAAICEHMGWDTDRVAAHWEHQAGKTDPAGIDMNRFRRVVAELLEEGLVDIDKLADTTAERTVRRLLRHEVTSRVTGKPVRLGHTVWGNTYRVSYEALQELRAGFAAMLAKLDGDGRDVAEVVRTELAAHRGELLTEVEDLLEQLADLVRQGQSGQLAAEQVVDEIGRRLDINPDLDPDGGAAPEQGQDGADPDQASSGP